VLGMKFVYSKDQMDMSFAWIGKYVLIVQCITGPITQ